MKPPYYVGSVFAVPCLFVVYFAPPIAGGGKMLLHTTLHTFRHQAKDLHQRSQCNQAARISAHDRVYTRLDEVGRISNLVITGIVDGYKFIYYRHPF